MTDWSASMNQTAGINRFHQYSQPGLRTPVTPGKISIPDVHAGTFERLRLIRLLADEGNAQPSEVTVVSGPAGAGKSVLLTQWVQARRAAGNFVAWITLGAEDNDATTLWSGLLLALERSGAWAPGSELHRLSSLGHRIDARFIALFIDAFDDLRNGPVTLILDDVHKITEPSVCDTLETFLRNLPDRFTLVLCGRSFSPFSIARLRVSGQVKEMGPRELAFTDDEMDLFLRHHGVSLPDDELQTLRRRTQGWAAGLWLAVMALRESDESTTLDDRFSGDDQRVADYLSKEVLAELDTGVQDFVRATCVCDELNADLAQALSGRDDAAVVLDTLEHTNSFLTRVRPGCYRYHPMMRDFLRSDLARHGPHTALRAHSAAATWLEAHGRTIEAIEHIGATGDESRLLQLLDRYGIRQVTNGNGWRIRAVIESLPKDSPTQLSSTMVLLRAATSLDAQNPTIIDNAVTATPVPPAKPSDPKQTVPGLVVGPPPWGIDQHREREGSVAVHPLSAAVTLQRARLSSEPGTVLVLLEREPVATGQTDLDLITSLERSTSWLWLGIPASASRELQPALVHASSSGRDWVTLKCLSLLAAAALASGDLVTAEARAGETLWLADRWHRSYDEPCRTARLVLAWVAYHRFDHDRARQLVQDVWRFSYEPRDVSHHLEPRLLAALTGHDPASGAYPTVRELREIWTTRWPGFVQPQLAAAACLIEQRLAYRAGAKTWAVDLIDRAVELIGETGDIAVLKAVGQAFRGRTHTARQLLMPILTETGTGTISPLSALEAWLWEARLAERSAEHQRADAALARAVRLAAPQCLVRPFVEGGVEVAQLLNRAADTFGHDETFVRSIQQVHRRGQTGAVTVAALTTRELEVLAELPSMRTAEEIASSHYVSVNTVKTHIRAIYRKLGASNRREAVQLARRFGLI